jgi:hypothetical protein
MNIHQLLAVPVPEKTASYTPISHKTLLSITRKAIEYKGYGWTFTFNTGRRGQEMVGTFVIGKGQFRRMVSVMNSYNKQLRVGVSSGVETFVCRNGCLFGDTVYLHKHTGDIDKQLGEVVNNQLRKLDDDFHNNMVWFKSLKKVTLKTKKMKKLASQLLEDDILKPRMFKVLQKEILKPSFDYGSSGTAYQFYQHCTHAIKKARPDMYVKLHKQLIQFTNEITTNQDA